MSLAALPTSTAHQSVKQSLRRHYTAVRKSLPTWRREEAGARLPHALDARLASIEGPVLSFVTIGSEIQTDLLNNSLGTRLRIPKLERTRIVLDDRPALIIVPGLVFDCGHHRLGYGMGFYDRLLEDLPDVPTCGIGFREQLSRIPLPIESHDLPLDEVLLL